MMYLLLNQPNYEKKKKIFVELHLLVHVVDRGPLLLRFSFHHDDMDNCFPCYSGVE